MWLSIMNQPPKPDRAILHVEGQMSSAMGRPARLTAQALKDFLPVDATLDATTIQTMRSRWPTAAKTNWARSRGPLWRAAPPKLGMTAVAPGTLCASTAAHV
jgi:hypothetical protein